MTREAARSLRKTSTAKSPAEFVRSIAAHCDDIEGAEPGYWADYIQTGDGKTTFEQYQRAATRLDSAIRGVWGMDIDLQETAEEMKWAEEGSSKYRRAQFRRSHILRQYKAQLGQVERLYLHCEYLREQLGDLNDPKVRYGYEQEKALANCLHRLYSDALTIGAPSGAFWSSFRKLPSDDKTKLFPRAMKETKALQQEARAWFMAPSVGDEVREIETSGTLLESLRAEAVLPALPEGWAESEGPAPVSARKGIAGVADNPNEHKG